MRTYALPLTLLLGLCPVAAQAQVHIGIEIGLPVAPRLEVISPGISVVAGFQEEVFFQSGWYWCRRGDGWYRARSPRARFEWVERHRVPRGLMRLPEGHYRNWHRDEPHGRGHEMGRGPERMPPGLRRQEERREERREDRREEHRERRGEEREHHPR